MSVIRHLPLRYRIPLIHSSLWLLSWLKSRRWPKATHHDSFSKGPVMVSGFFKESLGIGRAGRLNHDAFVEAGLNVMEHDIRPSFRHYVKGDLTLPCPPEKGVWLIHANPPEAVIAFMAHDPSQWQQLYRVGYWVWETPRLPDFWLWVLPFFHEVWLPSPFVFDAVRDGLTKQGREDLIARLRLMPYPVHVPDTMSPKTTDMKETRFVAMFDAHSSAERKNPWATLAAWLKAFPKPDSKAHLTLKVQNLDSDQASRDRLLSLIAERADISLFTERLSDDAMEDFIASFDVLISLHRSEGFGLPLAEAMALGVSVIATGWSGNLGFMTAENTWLVPYELVPITDPHGSYGHLGRALGNVWAEPDTAAAAAIICELAASPERREQKSARARQDIKDLNARWSRKAIEALPFAAYVDDSK